MNSQLFRGAMTALIKPFDSTGQIQEKHLRDLIDLQIQGRVDAIVPCGTTGEASTLNFEEHCQICELIVEHINKRSKVIIGAGSNNTEYAIEPECNDCPGDIDADGPGGDGSCIEGRRCHTFYVYLSRTLFVIQGLNSTPYPNPISNDDYPDLSKIETIHTQFGDIVIEHGDKHAVDYHNSLRASHPDALFIIYGHTHKHICDMKNKPYVLNPGAAGKTRTQGGASCGLINIDTSGNISVEIKKYTK